MMTVYQRVVGRLQKPCFEGFEVKSSSLKRFQLKMITHLTLKAHFFKYCLPSGQSQFRFVPLDSSRPTLWEICLEKTLSWSRHDIKKDCNFTVSYLKENSKCFFYNTGMKSLWVILTEEPTNLLKFMDKLFNPNREFKSKSNGLGGSYRVWQAKGDKRRSRFATAKKLHFALLYCFSK